MSGVRLSGIGCVAFALLLLFLFPACDRGTTAKSDAAPPAGEAPVPAHPGAPAPAPAEADERQFGGGLADPTAEPPVGDNPALEYGPYDFTVHYVELPSDNVYRSAYFFVPKTGKGDGPYPTIVWGHGIYSAYMPVLQMDLFHRLASRGILVIYPNVECPFFPEENTVTDGVVTYLRAIKKAVQGGLADPEQIIFGGYSMGARIAALATAVTTGLDPLHLWPDPIACVYEAMADFNEEPGLPVHIPGPRPSDWAPYINPAIPQTVIGAEEDVFAPLRNRETDEPDNSALFYSRLETDFAQLIVLKSGATWRDRATHGTFMVPFEDSADALDLWGHMKIVVGMANFHFLGGSRQWAYGLMRRAGGFDHDGLPMFHELHERHGGEEDQPDPQPEDPNTEFDSSAR